MARNPSPIHPRMGDARAYERALRMAYLKPFGLTMQRRLATAESATQAWRAMDQVVGDMVAKPQAGIPTHLIQDQLDAIKGYHRARVIQTFRSALALDITPVLSEPEVSVFMARRLRENVDLIKTIPTRLHIALKTDMDKWLDDHPFDQQALMRMFRHRYKSAGYNLRRITRDQNSKTVAGLTEVRQMQLGIGHYEWLTSQDERVRPTHVANSGLMFSWADPPAETGHPGEDVQCFPGSVSILPAGLKRSISYRYIGPVIEVVLADGVNVTTTPNHPILTETGWQRAGDLQEGVQLLVHPDGGDVASGALYPEFGDRNPLAEELHVFLGNTRIGDGASGRRLDLHGAPAHREEEIDIVEAKGMLRQRVFALGRQVFGDLILEDTHESPVGGHLGDRGTGFSDIAAGAVGLASECLAFLVGHPGHAQPVGLAAGACGQAHVAQAELHGAPLDAHFPGHALDRLASIVTSLDFVEMLRAGAGRELGGLWRQAEIGQAGPRHLPADPESRGGMRDGLALFPRLAHGGMVGHPRFTPARVTVVREVAHDGPVYSLETDSGIVVANGIVTHNCRCVAIPVVTKADHDRLAQRVGPTSTISNDLRGRIGGTPVP